MDVIGWCIQKGKQRYCSKSCGILFTRINKGVTQSNRVVWLKQWILQKQTLEVISANSGYSSRTLKRFFHEYLSSPPKLSVYPSEKVNLLIDGKIIFKARTFNGLKFIIIKSFKFQYSSILYCVPINPVRAIGIIV
jgi:AraC-like DNA-binding protein